MHPIATRVLATLLLFATFTTAHAQGTLTDGPVTFARTASSFDSSPLANLLGAMPAAGSDPLFEVGWAFRVSGDTRETFFPAPTTQNYAGNTSTITWADVGGRGLFSATEVVVLTDGGGPSARVQLTMTLTNLSATQPLVISVFNGIDIDANASAGNDSGSLEPAPLYRINVADTVAPAQTAQYYGVDADAYLVRPFAATTDVFGVLDNATVDDFDSTGVPFTNIDMTGGMEWMNETIAPGASASFVARFAINTTAFVELPDPMFADGFEDLPVR